MKRIAVALALGALLALPGAALAQDTFTADLNADEEVPTPTVPSDYAGTGSATVTISADDSQISYEVTYENLTGPLAAAHIHFGAEGEAGPVILPLDIGADAGASGSFSGTLTQGDFTAAEGGPQSFDDALEAMRSGNTYVNLHTEQNPPGEVRGQLTTQDGAKPPDTSTAEGPSSGPGRIMLLAAFGLAAVLLVTRRFAARST